MENKLNEKILAITNKIRERDPELLKYLNEMPVTIPSLKNPEITAKTLTSYYESLVALFDEYEESKANNTQGKKFENLQIVKIKNMEIADYNSDLIIEVNHFNVAYNDMGNGNIPIIFLHGFPFDKTMWKNQFEELKSSNRVIAIDIRGFGKSIDEKTPLSIDLFSDDLVAFMDKLKIKKAILCGLSMGGYISLNTIKRFPERFDALILCDTQCIADTPEGKENRYKTIEQIKLKGTTSFNEKFLKSVFHPDSSTDKKEIIENLRSVVFANSKEILIAGLTALAERFETCSSLNDIHIPTLIICGRQDQLTPLAQSEFMHKHIAGSSLKVIENAGHVSNLEQPEVFNNYIVNFLNSLNNTAK